MQDHLKSGCRQSHIDRSDIGNNIWQLLKFIEYRNG